MKLWLEAVIPDVGTFELATISAHIQQYGEDSSHPWGGILFVGDRRIGAASGLIDMPLGVPSRGGRKPATARDIAVFSACQYFKARGERSVGKHVAMLWWKRRVAANNRVGDEYKDAGRVMATDAIFTSKRPAPGYSGITDASHVSAASKRAQKHLDATAVAVVTYGGATGNGDARVMVLERGSRVQEKAGDPNCCVLRAPFWIWNYGDERAEHFDDGEVELQLRQPVPLSWTTLGDESLFTTIQQGEL